MSDVDRIKVTIEVPAMYGDHHVTEVKRLLLETPGVLDVYASSSFRVVDVLYDPEQTNDLELSLKLDEAGYLGEWSFLVEPEEAPMFKGSNGQTFRHTAVYEQTKTTVSFGHQVLSAGKPLWPCPGMGVIRKMEE
jgi:copper chaperone CopZ